MAHPQPNLVPQTNHLKLLPAYFIYSNILLLRHDGSERSLASFIFGYLSMIELLIVYMRIGKLLFIAWHMSLHTAVSFIRVYGEAIPVKELAERVASYVHLCTLYWWLRLILHLFYWSTWSLDLISQFKSYFNFCRPFGCGVIVGGYDRDGPQLYMIEPSGISYVSFSSIYLQMMVISSNFYSVSSIFWII